MATPPPAAVSDPLAKRKRGRPRKYPKPEDGANPLGIVLSSPTSGRPISPKPQPSTEKRGRGRPPGSGKKSGSGYVALPSSKAAAKLLVSEATRASAAGAAGNFAMFTPLVITVSVGDDVAGKILAFSQQGPRALCVLSANGTISSVTLRHDSSFGGNTTYEGKYEILSLSGSFIYSDVGGIRSRSGGLSVSLAAADGKVVGGSVSGLLIASSPVQIVLGSFSLPA